MASFRETESSHQAKVRALQHRHQQLKEQIRRERTHPSVNSLALCELKAEKLRLKDQIAEIEQRCGTH